MTGWSSVTLKAVRAPYSWLTASPARTLESLSQGFGLILGFGVGEVGGVAFEEFGGEADRFVQGGVGVDG